MKRFYRPELDCLRFGAFGLVFLFHTGASVGGPVAFAAGPYGVDLFFLLSAYLITELFIRENARTGGIDITAFYWRRVLRIWPLYFTFIALVALGAYAIPSIQMPSRATAALLLFVGNWHLAIGNPFFSPAGILWSVSVEEQFYICAPWAMRYLSRRGLAMGCFALIAVAATTRLVLLQHTDGIGLWYNTATRLDPIATGVLVALALRGRAPEIPVAARCALICAGLGVLYIAAVPLHGPRPESVLDGSLSYPLADLGSLALFFAFLGSRVAWDPIVYLGRISYGLYVFHLLALDVVKVLLLHEFGTCPWWARGALALPITIGLAAASYRWLEAPFLRLKRLSKARAIPAL